MRRAPLAAAVAAAALAAALAACHENVGPAACYDSGAQAYSFFLNGDSTLVFRWPKSYLPVRVYAEPTGELPANVQNAISLWESAFRCGELSLTVTTDSTRADIIVRNPPTLPALRSAATRVLFADSTSACHGVTQFALDSAGARLDGPMRSYVSPFPGADSASVASCYHFVTAHELGHALGLLAHSTNPADLMYPTPRRLALSADDRYTIQLLYHWTATIGPEIRR
jgi:predicted Zn-dependent protease